ncbi:hypothetical protein [Rubrivirga sp. IMCC45206]|uniref:hypothetical protein n=1 Tax=Rubrivirga sp. IMCC45206 TaxID=3391614 RepID=UPI00399007EC
MTTRATLLAFLALTACGDAADAPEAVAPETATVAPDAAPATAAPERVYTGTLQDGDDTLVSGEFLDPYEVIAREGQWIRAQVLSGDFDPYLMVLSPTGDQTEVDDSAAGNTSMTKAVLEATEAGKWTIVVTSFAPGETGDYELTFDVLDTRPDDADEGQQVMEPEPPAEPPTDV